MSDSEVEPWVEESRVTKATGKKNENLAVKEEGFSVDLCSVAPVLRDRN